jgi:hypothetical protein
MARLLSGYLQRAAARRFELGRFDCGLFLADWIMRCRGFDPAVNLRGRYDRLDQVPGIGGRGGLLRILVGLGRDYGLAVTRNPQLGDVALVSIAGGPLVGAIKGGRGWLVISEGGGISCAPSARLLRAWSVNG